MRKRSRLFVVGSLMIVALMVVAIPAQATLQATTTARKCYLANDILCVNHATRYDTIGCVFDGGYCTLRITDRISASARVAPGQLFATFKVLAPEQLPLLTATCSWPGVVTTGCSVSKIFDMRLSFFGNGECKDFDLVSRGTATMLYPLIDIDGQNPQVSSEKHDKMRICINPQRQVTLTFTPSPTEPPVLL